MRRHTPEPMRDCFLCAPDPGLVYAANASAFALCGLGPIVDGYSLVATREHTRSFADSAAKNGELIPFTQSVRNVLSDRYGPCLLSEHGRLPTCTMPTAADGHCFHAHFLLFPGSPDIAEQAQTYFARVVAASTLKAALAIARKQKEYFLLSPNPDRYFVMTRPGRLIRQFARLLVAEAVGHPELANWERHPEKQKAEADAAALCQVVPEAIQTSWKQRK